MELQQSTSADTAGSRTLPPGDAFANADEHVFIPLDVTAQKLMKLVFEEPGQITFVRAPVAAGKSTLANFLANSIPENFALVETADTEEQWEHNLMKAHNNGQGVKPVKTAREAVDALQKQNKALIIDEAHLLFDDSCQKFYAKITKLWMPQVKMLLFSAAATGRATNGGNVATPTNILKKYMWYPPFPDGEILAPQLQDAGVLMSGDAVNFLMKVCCGHYGIFMMAVGWVAVHQKANSQGIWDLDECVTEVRLSLEENEKRKRQGRSGWSLGLKKSLAKCRAVKVSGGFSDPTNIPSEFMQVLFGGSKLSFELHGKERDLTIAGFLVPERGFAEDEFVLYDWTDVMDTRFGVANSLMAEYYNDVFTFYGYEKEVTEYTPNSGYDLLSRALPFLTFTSVVDNVLIQEEEKKSPLSPQKLPYEDHYNGALSRIFTELGYTVNQPLGADGKVDMIVQFAEDIGNPGRPRTCAIATIMAHRTLSDHNEHAQRFAITKKLNYSGAHFKVLVTIGSKRNIVSKRVADIDEVQGVEIVGLVASQVHSSYEVFIRKAGSTHVKGPFFLLCDRVAKTFEENVDLPFKSVQSCQKKRKMDDMMHP